jgi:FAD/FMN-containing dehydrogenase
MSTLSRRELLIGLVSAWAGSGCSSQSPGDDLSVSPGDEPFPSSTAQRQAAFLNWSQELDFPNLRAFTPQTENDLVDVANWCARNNFALRPRGAMHNWSPLALSESTTPDTPLVLADMLTHLNRIELTEIAGIPAVRAQAGATLESIMGFIGARGFGLTSTPVLGNISIGGALAIDGHGCAAPAVGEVRVAGQTYGSLSNRVLMLTAIVWDQTTNAYAPRTFARTDPEIGALLVSLGRALISEVTLAIEPEQKLRCMSYIDIPVSEMFGAPGTAGRSLASFVDSAGRLEAIWYPFTDNPWLKVWSVSPAKPPSARVVTQPYNYPFTDSFPTEVVELAEQAVTGLPPAGLLVGPASYAVTAAGLLATLALDLWGASKDLLLWLRPETLRVHHGSFVAITRRDQVQRVVSDFIAKYRELRDACAARGEVPMNMPIEIRVTGLDRPEDCGIAGAQPALLSAIAPVAERPDWDTAVWLSAATLPGTPGHHAFKRDLEQWAFSHFSGDYALLRPEWSKGWAYTADRAWADADVLDRIIPQSFGASWNAAIETLDALDPRGIYRHEFSARLLKPT